MRGTVDKGDKATRGRRRDERSLAAAQAACSLSRRTHSQEFRRLTRLPHLKGHREDPRKIGHSALACELPERRPIKVHAYFTRRASRLIYAELSDPLTSADLERLFEFYPQIASMTL
jgi:hypothetical protein